MAKKEDQAKLVAILSYITIIGWVIALILNQNNKTKLGSFHVRQSLILIIAGALGSVIFWIPLIGWALFILLVVFWIMGLVYAIQGQMKEIPLIGSYAQRWFKGL